jgi:dTDP-4-amino-4,6-dideoxygalactose transaminase
VVKGCATLAKVEFMALSLGLREWGPAELWAGLRGAAALTSQSADEAALTRWFSEGFGVPALIVNSGSSALQLALHLLSQQNLGRKEVVLPALACPALTRVVLACGLQPRYVDIAPNLNTPVDVLRRSLGPSSLAVIMVHAYGHPADSFAIQALCQTHGIALIDDAAQRIEPGSGLGTAGDFGIFSFAQSKSVVCGIDGSGGVLLVNSHRQLAALAQQWRQLPVAGRRHRAWLEFLLTPGAPRAAYYISRWRQRGATSHLGPARIAGIDAAIALPQLASLDSRRQRRLRLLQQYGLALSRFNVPTPQLTSASNPDYLTRLMINVVPEQRENCRQALAARGIASRLPYRLPTSLDVRACPQAARSAAELLELPLPAKWSADEITLAAGLVAPFCAATPTQSNTVSGAIACNITGN